MKIIGVSNYDKETIDDILICENIYNDHYGKKIVDSLNSNVREGSTYFYRLVDNDHKLYKFEI